MKNMLVFVTVAIAILGPSIRLCRAAEGDIGLVADLEPKTKLFPCQRSQEPPARDTVEVIIGIPYTGNLVPFWGSFYNACRYQVLFFQSEINIAGEIISFSLMPSTNAIGTYNNVRMYCCHTRVAELSDVFDNNYSGNTPVEVMNEASFSVGGSADIWLPWEIRFPYNNADNLLVEIRWNGDYGVDVPFWRTGESVFRRVFAWDDHASTGSAWRASNYVKLTIVTTGIEEEIVSKSPRILLEQNIPNPFSRLTKINFDAGHSAEDIKLKIYDVAGRLIKQFDGIRPVSAGRGEVVWDGKDEKGVYVENGVYFYKLQTGERVVTRSMICLR